MRQRCHISERIWVPLLPLQPAKHTYTHACTHKTTHPATHSLSASFYSIRLDSTRHDSMCVPSIFLVSSLLVQLQYYFFRRSLSSGPPLCSVVCIVRFTRSQAHTSMHVHFMVSNSTTKHAHIYTHTRYCWHTTELDKIYCPYARAG